MPPRHLLVTLVLGVAQNAYSATILTNAIGLQAVGSSTVNGGTAFGTTSVSTPLPNSKGTVLATAQALAESDPFGNSENFSLTTTSSTRADAVRTVNSGAPVDGRSTASHTVTFELGLNEQIDLVFDMVTTLQQQNLSGRVTWSLIGPNGAIGAMGGSVTAAGTNVPIAQRSTTLTQAGTYTFTVTASSNSTGDKLHNSNDFSRVTINSMTLTGISSIPEPGVAGLAILSLTGLAIRRRRSCDAAARQGP